MFLSASPRAIFLIAGIAGASARCQNAPLLAPVPSDPNELVTIATQEVPSVGEPRNTALTLLRRASPALALGRQYVLTLAFTAEGPDHSQLRAIWRRRALRAERGDGRLITEASL